MGENEVARGLVRGVEEHRAQVAMLLLQAPDNGVTPAHVRVPAAVGVQGQNRERLTPTGVEVDPACAVDAADDRARPVLPQPDGDRTLPPLDREGHHDLLGVGRGRDPLPEVPALPCEVERPLRDAPPFQREVRHHGVRPFRER
jgi:hypothetical protein